MAGPLRQLSLISAYRRYSFRFLRLSSSGRGNEDYSWRDVRGKETRVLFFFCSTFVGGTGVGLPFQPFELKVVGFPTAFFQLFFSRSSTLSLSIAINLFSLAAGRLVGTPTLFLTVCCRSLRWPLLSDHASFFTALCTGDVCSSDNG